jgi:hypothetical protein
VRGIIASLAFYGDPLSLTVAAFLKHLALPHSSPLTRTIILLAHITSLLTPGSQLLSVLLFQILVIYIKREELAKQTVLQECRIYRTTRQMHISDNATSDEYVLDRRLRKRNISMHSKPRITVGLWFHCAKAVCTDQMGIFQLFHHLYIIELDVKVLID